ncbi:MAG: co-chaperone GroES [Candidatus Paceibacterota bacterium]
MSKLLLDRVLIEPEEQTGVTEAGVYISKDKQQGEYRIGIVKEIGTGKHFDSGFLKTIDVSVGDRVLFQYGAEILIEGKMYLLVMNDDIIRIF